MKRDQRASEVDRRDDPSSGPGTAFNVDRSKEPSGVNPQGSATSAGAQEKAESRYTALLEQSSEVSNDKEALEFSTPKPLDSSITSNGNTTSLSSLASSLGSLDFRNRVNPDRFTTQPAIESPEKAQEVEGSLPDSVASEKSIKDWSKGMHYVAKNLLARISQDERVFDEEVYGQLKQEVIKAEANAAKLFQLSKYFDAQSKKVTEPEADPLSSKVKDYRARAGALAKAVDSLNKKFYHGRYPLDDDNQPVNPKEAESEDLTLPSELRSVEAAKQKLEAAKAKLDEIVKNIKGRDIPPPRSTRASKLWYSWSHNPPPSTKTASNSRSELEAVMNELRRLLNAYKSKTVNGPGNPNWVILRMEYYGKSQTIDPDLRLIYGQAIERLMKIANSQTTLASLKDPVQQVEALYNTADYEIRKRTVFHDDYDGYSYSSEDDGISWKKMPWASIPVRPE